MPDELNGRVFNRVSARLGEVVDLNVTFYHAGAPTDPQYIEKVEIYKTQVLPQNLVATFNTPPENNPNYPSPIIREYVQSEAGQCGTEPVTSQVALPGRYHLVYVVPDSFQAPDVYIDLWYYYTQPLTTSSKPLRSCNRFWVYPNEWFVQDGLQSVNFGFEPLNQKYYTPEIKPLEVGLMPLPLYDYNYNLVHSIIPMLQATITIKTSNDELLIDKSPLTIGVRQGSYRTNPWVLRYNLDTSKFLKGTYTYQVNISMPDGTSRVSKPFIFTIS